MKNKLLFLVLGTLILIAGIAQASAFSNLFRYEFYNQNENNLEWIDSAGGDGNSWQTFTTGITSVNTTFNLQGVSIKTANDPGGSLTIYAKIFQGYAGNNSCDLSTSLGSGSYTANPIGNGWINITMTQNATITKGGKYCLYINSSSSNEGLGWGSDRATSGYAGGQVGNDANNAPNTAWDALFELWGVNATSTAPNITVSQFSPSDGTIVGASNITLSSLIVPTNLTIKNLSVFTYYSNGTLFNTSILSVSGNNTVTANTTIYGLTLGNYYWNSYACGNASSVPLTVCAFTSTNNSFTSGATLSQLMYANSTYETSFNKFSAQMNLLPSSTLYDVKFVYNNSLYPGSFSLLSGNTYVINSSIDVPLVPTNSQNATMPFYFQIIYSPSANTFIYQNSTMFNQTVLALNLSTCAGGNITANFTAYDEENLSSIGNFNFLATFNYWIGSGSVYKNLSINNQGVAGTKLCITPSNYTYKANSIIQYESTNYVKRSYYLINSSLNNITQEFNLFLLNTAKATSFIISVKQADQIPVDNAYLYIQRYYPGTNLFQTVGMVKTDQNGKSVASFEAETEDYKTIVFKDGMILDTSPVQKIFCSSTPCTYSIQVGGNGVQTWNSIGNLSNLIWSLDFNYTTNIWSFTYVDTSGTTHYGRLFVYQNNPGGIKKTICNTNSTASAATLNCNVTGYDGTVNAEIYISRSPESFIYLKTVILNTVKSIFGFEGLWWAFIVIIILACAGAIVGGPSGAIVGVVAGVILLPIIGIAAWGAVFIWAIIVLGIVFLWLLNS